MANASTNGGEVDPATSGGGGKEEEEEEEQVLFGQQPRGGR